jgi:hypothetical protein
VVVVGPGFWFARLSSRFLAARALRAHSIRVMFFLYRLIKSADTKNEFLLLVSPTVISAYQK